jgi:hypothetical protein
VEGSTKLCVCAVGGTEANVPIVCDLDFVTACINTRRKKILQLRDFIEFLLRILKIYDKRYAAKKGRIPNYRFCPFPPEVENNALKLMLPFRGWGLMRIKACDNLECAQKNI